MLQNRKKKVKLKWERSKREAKRKAKSLWMPS